MSRLPHEPSEKARAAVTAAKYWLSRRAGWKETQLHQIEGGDRGPIESHDRSVRKRILARIAAIHTGDET
jgi:hypothetical protein